MSQKTTAVIVLIVLIGFGFLAGTFFSGFFGQLTVPASHKAIVDNMAITTLTNPPGATLTHAYLSSGKATWQLSSLTVFPKGNAYTYSLWVYSYEGDPELAVCITGPGTDGTTYQVEVTAFWHGRSYTLKQGTNAPIDFTDNTLLTVTVA